MSHLEYFHFCGALFHDMTVASDFAGNITLQKLSPLDEPCSVDSELPVDSEDAGIDPLIKNPEDYDDPEVSFFLKTASCSLMSMVTFRPLMSQMTREGFF